MARLVAQLALQQAMGLPVRMCRTAEELAEPARAESGLSFVVPLGRGGEALPLEAVHTARRGGGADEPIAKGSKGLAKGGGKAMHGTARPAAGAVAELRRGARKQKPAACASASGELRAVCEKKATVRRATGR